MLMWNSLDSGQELKDKYIPARMYNVKPSSSKHTETVLSDKKTLIPGDVSFH